MDEDASDENHQKLEFAFGKQVCNCVGNEVMRSRTDGRREFCIVVVVVPQGGG